MKKLMLWTFVFAALSGGALFAQDLTGTWQGTLQAGRELRTVIKITKNGAAMKGTLYSIDQGGQGLPISVVTLEGSTVKMNIPGIGGSYEGKLDSDGTSITGNFTQADHPLPLNLKKATAETAWAIPEPPARLKPMAADANPVFEVATIKPSKPGAVGNGILVRGRQFSTINTSVADLITFAYGVHSRQIVGGPAWLETEKYDLMAKPDGEGQPNDRQWKAMVAKLLVDRFQLKFHQEQKELSVYAIVPGKTGPKLTPSGGDPNGLPGLFFRKLGVLTCRNANMADFAHTMQAQVLDRPVVDQTKIAGRFDFELKWTPDETQFAGFGARAAQATDDANAPPDLYTAIQEQLGLRLVAEKAPVDVMVIDRAEKASAN